MGFSIPLVPSFILLSILVERMLRAGIPAIVAGPGTTVVGGIVWLEEQSQGQRALQGVAWE